MGRALVSPFSKSFVTQAIRVFVCCVAVIVLALSTAKQANAWGIVGHRIVCELAYGLLDSQQQASVDQLTFAFKKPNGKKFKSFSESCSFADTARHNARDGLSNWQAYKNFDRWHYVNLPRDTVDAVKALGMRTGDSVLTAIAHHGAVLRDEKIDLATRGEALIMLAHWVGDVHQPVHVAFADDRGGSAIKLDKSAGLGRHFHSAWDSGIIKASRGGRRLRKYITDLSQINEVDIKQWRREKSIFVWAAESYAITTSPVAQYCQWRTRSWFGLKKSRACEPMSSAPKVNAQYVSRIAPLLEQRLQQAAVRLAAMIASSLSQ